MNPLQAMYAVNDFLDQGGAALYAIFFMAVVFRHKIEAMIKQQTGIFNQSLDIR
jgi:hypothetical protein